MKNAVLSLARHLLTAAGAYAVGKGIFSEQLMLEIVAGLTAVIGGAWGIWDEFKAERAAKNNPAD